MWSILPLPPPRLVQQHEGMLEDTMPLAEGAPSWVDTMGSHVQGQRARMSWSAPLGMTGWTALGLYLTFFGGMCGFGTMLSLPIIRSAMRFLSFLQDDVNTCDLLVNSHRGTWVDRPYNVARLRGVAISNRISV